jgi:RNA polymerase sigma factor (sigma-70 family)
MPDAKLDHRNQSGLPVFCQELFFRFCMDFRNETFEPFYYSTVQMFLSFANAVQMFLSFANERCYAYGKRWVDPREIVNRLYGVLIAHASGNRRFPFKAMLSWCFGVINNMIKEEIRRCAKSPLPMKCAESQEGGKDPLDHLLQKEETKHMQDLYNRVMEFLTSSNAVLSERDRKVMHLFYCEGQSLKKIAKIQKIRMEHVAVILFRSRKRIAVRLRSRLARY